MNALHGEPWAITEAGLQLVTAVASRDEFFAEAREQALAARDGAPLENTRSVEMRGGVAVIPVMGPLFRHANLITRLSGATSYAALRKDLQVAIEDKSVTSILLNIDSPGGEANGVIELAEAIREGRNQKPITAYVGGMGASAAYWIASAADRVVASPTASLGSIGVIATMVDEKPDPTSLKRSIDFVSSQSPHKRPDMESKPDRARIQRRVDDLAQVFVDSVAKNRGVSPMTVLERFGAGDVMVGARAVENGLADSLGSFESTLSTMQGGHVAQEKQMKTVAKALGLEETASEAELLAAVNEKDAKLAEKDVQITAQTARLASLEADAKASNLKALERDLDSKIEAFAIDPSEKPGLMKLAAKDPVTFAELVGARTPRNPSGKKLELPTKVPGSTDARAQEQRKAIETYQAAHEDADYTAAFIACANENPTLFSDVGEGN